MTPSKPGCASSSGTRIPPSTVVGNDHQWLSRLQDRRHTAMTSARAIAGKLQGRRIREGEYLACCPAHDDRNPSLSISQKGDKTLLHCWSGCPQNTVIGALQGLGAWPRRKQHQGRAWLSSGQILYMRSYIEIYLHEVARAINSKLSPEEIIALHTPEEHERVRQFSRMLKSRGIRL